MSNFKIHGGKCPLPPSDTHVHEFDGCLRHPATQPTSPSESIYLYLFTKLLYVSNALIRM